jgi:hypothetical protein
LKVRKPTSNPAPLSQFQTPAEPRRTVGFFGSGSLPSRLSLPVTQPTSGPPRFILAFPFSGAKLGGLTRENVGDLRFPSAMFCNAVGYPALAGFALRSCTTLSMPAGVGCFARPFIRPQRLVPHGICRGGVDTPGLHIHFPCKLFSRPFGLRPLRFPCLQFLRCLEAFSPPRERSGLTLPVHPYGS